MRRSGLGGAGAAPQNPRMVAATPEPAFRRDVPHGRVLVFAPHPDDEVVGPGGCLALHARAGDPVRVVVATTGGAGDPDRRFDPSTYAARREAESRAGLRELGVHDAVYWRLPDNQALSESDLELGRQLATAALAEFRPDVVYLPWEREGHPDHHALHEIVVAALARAGCRGEALGYEVWNAMVPDFVVDVTAVAERKRAALRAHASQL
ncbi:MAG: PIG-L family deacetylase, partial [Planctomycetes bacterium]|nr:PIG-L family deacetylase [Planctomycetota bacterium]